MADAQETYDHDEGTMENRAETHSYRWYDPRGWNSGWHLVAVGVLSFLVGLFVAPSGVSQKEYRGVAAELLAQTDRVDEAEEELSLLEESQSQIEEEASSLREQLDEASSEASLLREENQSLREEVDLLSSATGEVAIFEAFIRGKEPEDLIHLCTLFSVSPRSAYDSFTFEAEIFEEFSSLLDEMC